MFHILTFGLALLLLAGCGGGGGRSGQDGRWSNATIEQVLSRVDDLAYGQANVFHRTDELLSDQQGQFRGDRSPVTCEDDYCESTVRSGRGEVSLSLRSYTSYDFRDIVPIGERNGVEIGERDPRGQFEDDESVYVLGAWMQEGYAALFHFTQRDGYEQVHALSIGNAPGTNPMAGSATWRGAMIGMETPSESKVTGDAMLTFDFASNDLDVSMTNIRDRAGGIYDPLTWTNVPVMNGRFAVGAGDDSLSGSFYGPTHEEVGGIFERDEIIGAFGASRQ